MPTCSSSATPTSRGSREIEGVLFVNDGSVGKPKDGDPRAAWALLTGRPPGKPVEVEIRRVPYDVATHGRGDPRRRRPARPLRPRSGNRRRRRTRSGGRRAVVGAEGAPALVRCPRRPTRKTLANPIPPRTPPHSGQDRRALCPYDGAADSSSCCVIEDLGFAQDFGLDPSTEAALGAEIDRPAGEQR